MKGRKYLLLVFVLLLAATPLYAGSEEKTDAIVAYTEELYDEPFDTDALRDPIAKALNEGISQEQLTTFIAANIQTDVEIPELVFYLENISATQAEGLPSYLIMNTILEGIAKGATEEEMRTSLMTSKKQIRFCHTVSAGHKHKVKRSSREKALLTSALYNALHMGFSEDALEQLSTSVLEHHRSSVMFLNSLEVLMELHSLGLENEQSILLIENAIIQDYRVGHIRSFPMIFSTQMNRGFSQEEIFAALQEDIKYSRAPSLGSDKGSTHTGHDRSSEGSGSGGNSPSQDTSQSSGNNRKGGNGRK
jgi:hypothetical protein